VRIPIISIISIITVVCDGDRVKVMRMLAQGGDFFTGSANGTLDSVKDAKLGIKKI